MAPRTRSMPAWATPGQITWIRDLAEMHRIPEEIAQRLADLLSSHEEHVRTGKGERMPGQLASDTIKWLGSQPLTTEAAAAMKRKEAGEAAEPGAYEKDGRFYVIREFSPKGETRVVRYAREVTDVGELIKAPFMQFWLTRAHLLSGRKLGAFHKRFPHLAPKA